MLDTRLAIQALSKHVSTGFDILLSPEDEFEAIDVYQNILRLILNVSGVRRSPLKLTIYRGQRPFHYGTNSTDPHIVFSGELHETGVFKEIVRWAGREVNENREVFIGVTCSYDLLRWNNESCDYEPSSGTFSFEYESSGFNGGHAFRMRGPYCIHFFDNKRVFTPRAVDLSRCPANPVLLSRLIEYGRNTSFVESLCKEIAKALRPSYLFVVDEGEPVHPLNFHMVYHKSLRGYLYDVQKILQVHALGGGYFYEGRYDEFDPAYSSVDTVYENDLRPSDGATTLSAQLDHFCSVLGTGHLNEIRLSDEEIYDLIGSTESANPEDVGGSIFLTRSFMGYLDELYLKLLDWAVTKNINRG